MKTKFLLLIFALISFAISAQAEIRKYHGSDSSVIFSVEGTEFLVEGLYIAGNKEASRFSGYLDIYYDKQIAYICHVQFYHKINESFFDTGTNGVCWLIEQQIIEGEKRNVMTIYLKNGEKKTLLEDPK